MKQVRPTTTFIPKQVFYYFLLFIIAGAVQSNSTATIDNPSPEATVMDCADIVVSSASAACATSFNFNVVGDIFGTTFDFNNGTLPSGWTASPFVVGQPCNTDMVDGSDYFWATTTNGAGQRFVQTNSLNVSGGGQLEYFLRFGNDDPANGCEDPDAGGENVLVQYSIDNGSSWNTFRTFTPSSPNVYTWEAYSDPIPAAAQSASTLFRWIQLTNSGDDFDNWGLDVIQVSAATNATFNWDFGDGGMSTAQNPSYTYAAQGTYTVTLTVTSPNCSPNPFSTTESVSVGPGPSLSTMVTQPDCSNNVGSITVTHSGTAPFTYNWSPNVSSGPTASNLAPGLYEVTVTDNAGCNLSNSITLVDAGCPPNASCNGGTLVCECDPGFVDDGNGNCIIVLTPPEIDVLGNSVSIADGDNNASVDDHTHFGSVLDGDNLVRTYTISNVAGATDLTVSSIGISGTDAANFTLGGITLPAVISGGSSTTFTVSFTPSFNGTHNGTVTINNDDADESIYDFAIQVQGNMAHWSSVTSSLATGELGGVSVTLAGPINSNSSTIDGNYSGFAAQCGTPAFTDRIWLSNSNISGPTTLTMNFGAAVTDPIFYIDGLHANLDFGANTIVQLSGDGAVVGGGTIYDPTPNADAALLIPGTFTSIVFEQSPTGGDNWQLSVGLPVLPEIDVLGNGMSIPDGDTSPSTTDDTDFNSVCAATTRTFTIDNSVGTASLELDGTAPNYVTISGSADFTISAQPASNSIPPGGSTTFEVTYTPNLSGTQTATISIPNSDCDEDPYNFRVNGRFDVTDPITPTLADVTGECSVTVTAPTTTDNCAGTITGTTTDPVVYNTQGTFTITWTFDDGNGNSVTANQTVIVDDVTDPVTPTLSTVTEECSVTVTAPTTTDNCAGTITGTTTDPVFYNSQGTFTITWTFDDGNGNSVTANQTVIVDDVTDPVIPTLADATGECSVTVSAPTTTDNCAGTITGTTTDPLVYNNQGTFTITWTFDDGNGNSVTANQTVIVDDVTGPSLACQDITVMLDGNGMATITPQDILLPDVLDLQENNTTRNGAWVEISVADVNSDGNLDFAIVQQSVGNVVDVFLGDGTGSFSLHQQIAGSQSRDLDLVNLDGDSDLEMLIYQRFGPVIVLDNDGSGTFTTSSTTAGIAARSGESGDVNNDGFLDIFTIFENQASMLWLNDGSNGFTNSGQTFANSNGGIVQIHIKDVTGDGIPDIFAPTTTGMVLYLNDGMGNFTASPQSFGSALETVSGMDDVNGDGSLDIVLGGNVYLNNGSGTFTDSGQTVPSRAVLLDLDDDGDLDIYGLLGANSRLYLNDGAGVFTDSGYTGAVIDYRGADIGDMNNDGKVDIMLVGANNYAYLENLSVFGVSDNCDDSPSLMIDVSSFDCNNVGTPVDVTVTATDAEGNTGTCTQAVTVTDTELPTANCNNISVTLDGSGSYTLTATDEMNITAGSDDNCGTSFSFSQTMFDCGDLSGQLITVTVEDPTGNQATCDATITSVDDTDPITPTLATITEECSATVTAPTTTDNCAGTITGTTTDPVSFNSQGTFTITWTFDDGNGNSVTANQTVIVDDVMPPTFTCPSAQTVTLNANCEMVIPDLIGGLTVNDNCSAMLTQVPTATSVVQNLVDGDTETVTITATDVGGNTNTTPCTVTLTATAPEITVAGNGTEIMDGDNTPNAGDGTNYGSQLANTNTDRTFTITNDGSLPLNLTDTGPNFVSISGDAEFTILTQPATATIAPGASVSFVVRFTPTGNGSFSAVVSVANNDCNEDPYTFTVAGGLNCVVTIDNIDVTNEICPGANDGTITVMATPTGLTGSLEYSINGVDYQSSNVFSGLMPGSYDVTVRDDGNTSCNAEQMGVMIAAGTDTEDPVITCPGGALMVVYTETFDVANKGITGACTGSLPASCASSDLSGVTWTLGDVSGFDNGGDFVRTQADGRLLIQDSNTPSYWQSPPISTTPGAEVTFSFDLEYILITSGNFIDVRYSTDGGTTFQTSNSFTGTGTTTVNEIGIVAGNSFLLRLVVQNDGTERKIFLDNVTISTEGNNTVIVDNDPGMCSAVVVLTDPMFSDNCSAVLTNDAPASYPVGNTTVTFTATDPSGNTATCTQVVTVNDAEAPMASCTDISVTLDGNGDYTLTAADEMSITAGSTDNCGGMNDITFSFSQNTFDCDDISGQLITVTVQDLAGNQSTCDATITAVDNMPPTFVCPSGQTVDLDANCELIVPNLISGLMATDNCSATFTQTPLATSAVQNLNDGDTQVVTITATDPAGNTNVMACNVTLTANNPGTVAISDVTMDEGDSGATIFNFTVTLSNPGCAFDVDYATADNGAVAGDDYVADSGTLSFSAGESSKTISITVNGDTDVELNDAFFVNLTNATNGVNITDAQGLGTINNDDSAEISIADANVVEGNSGTTTLTFDVSLSRNSATPVTVNYSTSDGTATTADSDYDNATGMVTFGPNVTMQTVSVTVNGDTKLEGDETMTVTLNTPVGATIDDGTATGTITNDDAVSVSIDDVTAVEGSGGGMTAFEFTVSLAGEVQDGFTLAYTTNDGTATAADYTDNDGSVTFAGTLNETETITVQVTADDIVEADETFTVLLGAVSGLTGVDASDFNIQNDGGDGVITNDDAASFAIADVTMDEGDAGATTFTFTVTLTGDIDQGYAIDYATSDGTATTADNDYVATNGTLNFAGNDGETQTFAVTVNGDVTVELDDVFNVTLSSLQPAGSGGTNVSIADGSATGTITNDDSAQISIADAMVVEGNAGTTTLVFDVSLSTSSTTPVTVNYSTSDGTATTADSDYDNATGTVTFGPNVTMQTISVTVNGDFKLEADETMMVTLASPVGATIDDGTAMGTITNDDIVGINIDDVTAIEGSGGGTTAFEFTVSLIGEVQDGFTLAYTTNDGTATAADYTDNDGSVTFAGTFNETETITVQVTADDIVEADETFTVLLGAVSGLTGVDAADFTIQNDGGDGVITNDDAASFAIADVTMDEGDAGATTFTFTVTLTGDIDQGYDIDYATSDGTATTADNDYIATNGTLNFAGTDGETQTFDVTVNGDVTVELDDVFNVTLSNLQPAGSGGTNVSIADATATGTITNDDATQISIADAVVVEGNAGTTTLIFDVSLSTNSTTPVTVNYSTSDGTATTTDSDYDNATGMVTFGPNVTMQTVSVTVNGDTKLEGDENMTVTLNTPVGATIDDGTATGTITNDDAVSVSIDDVTAVEGSGGGMTAFEFTVSLAGEVQDGFTLAYTTNDGTATAADYTDNDGSVTFAGTLNETETITVQVTADDLVEADETFTVLLGAVSGLTGVDAADFTIQNDGGDGVITNDDAASFAIADVTMDEGDAGATTFTFTVTLTGDIDQGYDIDYATSDGTATTANNDYIATNGTLNFAGNDGETQTFTVTVNGDVTVELDDVFNITLDNLQPAGTGGTNVSIADDSATGTITNDDAAEISIADAMVVEGNAGTSTLLFDVSLSTSSANNVTVDYVTSDGTATTADSDYGATGGTVTFFPGEMMKTISVTVNGDTKLEGDETMMVNLSSPMGATISDDTAIGTITNDDAVSVSIDDITALEGSGGGMTAFAFTVSLSGEVQDGFTLAYTTNDGTATGADYTDNDGSITFAGTLNETETITVQVTADDIVEADETFTVLLGAVSGLTGVDAGDFTVQNDGGDGVITNDDAATFAIADVTMNEGDAGMTTFTFTVTLTGDIDQGYSVDYATSDGTATTANNDYVAINGTLTFTGNDGETQTFSVMVNGDVTVEADEAFNTTISNLQPLGSGGTSVTIADDSAIGNITNDDVAALNIADASDDEGSGQLDFVVSLSNPLDVDITFEVTTNDGTATTGDGDYAAQSGMSYTISAGQTMVTVPVAIIDDPVNEPDENFTVALSNAMGSPSISIGDGLATGTIVNDDFINISISDETVVEGNAGQTPLMFTVSLDGTSSQTITVDFTTTDGTATIADNDYVFNSGTIVFNPGETSKTVTILALGDLRVEGDQQFTVDLSNPTIAAIGDGQGQGTITNDDMASVVVDVNGNTVVEGDVGNTPLTIPVSVIGGPVDTDITVNYTLVDGTATLADNDYADAASGSVTIPAESTGVDIIVNVIGDTNNEDNEQFTVTITSVDAMGLDVTLGDATAPANIIDDDFVCPTIGALNGDEAICMGETRTLTATGLATMAEVDNNGADFGIRFVYFNGPTADPYTGGTDLGTVSFQDLDGGGNSATFDATFPMTTTDIVVYAVLSPVPDEASCRPAQALSISVLECGITNDDDNNPTIADPCICKNNATTLDNGQFDELVEVLNAPAGETWTVTAINGLFLPSSPAPPAVPLPITIGTSLTEVPTGTPGVSNYELVGIHVDAIGYDIMVSNGITTLGINNRCWYPNPSFTNLAPSYCRTANNVTLMGTAQLGDGSGEATPEMETYVVIQLSTGNTVVNAEEGSAILDIANLPAGQYRVIYTFDAADDNPDQNHPGCSQSIERVFELLEVNCGTFPWSGN